MKEKQMKSYKQFLVDTENQGDANSYTRIPKAILFDINLTAKEKLLWISICSFMFTSKKDSFPSRMRLAKILEIKNDTSISRLTRRLQDKGYLEKSYAPEIKRVYYEPYFHKNAEDDPFMDRINLVTVMPSKHNKEYEDDG